MTNLLSNFCTWRYGSPTTGSYLGISGYLILYKAWRSVWYTNGVLHILWVSMLDSCSSIRSFSQTTMSNSCWSCASLRVIIPPTWDNLSWSCSFGLDILTCLLSCLYSLGFSSSPISCLRYDCSYLFNFGWGEEGENWNLLCFLCRRLVVEMISVFYDMDSTRTWTSFLVFPMLLEVSLVWILQRH